MNSNYKVNIKDIQDKYTFKIFCAGADTTEIEQEIEELDTRVDTLETNITNKEDKSNKVTTLSNTSTDTQYPSAKCVYDSQTLQDANIEENTTNIEELKTFYESIYNVLPKVSGTGESLTLNETAESVMKNKLYPQMEQASTTGKNFLEDVILTTEITTRGVTFTPVYKENGELEYININGTPTTNFAMDINTRGTRNPLIFTQETQVICSGTTTGSSSTYRLVYNYYDSGGTENAGAVVSTEEKTFTYPANSTIHAYIYVFSGATINNVRVYPMIRLATISDSTYEPYTNGASPNPSYPQPIHTISGDNTIKVSGKNLLNVPSEYSVTGNVEFSVNLPAGTYYVSMSSITLGGANTSYIRFATDTTTVGSFQASSSNLSGSVTINRNATKLYIYSQDNYQHSVGVTTSYKNLMISASNTTYEPYQSQSKQINLGELEYNAIGDYKDEFVKVDGEWFLRKNIGKYTFDENNNFSSSSGTFYTDLIQDYAISGNVPLCTKYKGILNVPNGSSATSLTNNYEMAFRNNIDYYRFYIRDDDYSDLTLFKNSIIGTSIYYALATPQTISLPTTLQNQIESLYNETMSYKGQTNISQVNNDLAFVVEGSALKDMSNDA